jgi:hypothetical protein
MSTKHKNADLIGNWYRMQHGWQEHSIFGNEPYSSRDAWIWLIDNAIYAPEGRSVSIKGRPVF